MMPGVTESDDSYLVCLRPHDARSIVVQDRNPVQRKRGLRTLGAMGSGPGCPPLVHSRRTPVTVERGWHDWVLVPSAEETAKNVPEINIHSTVTEHLTYLVCPIWYQK